VDITCTRQCRRSCSIVDVVAVINVCYCICRFELSQRVAPPDRWVRWCQPSCIIRHWCWYHVVPASSPAWLYTRDVIQPSPKWGWLFLALIAQADYWSIPQTKNWLLSVDCWCRNTQRSVCNVLFWDWISVRKSGLGNREHLMVAQKQKLQPWEGVAPQRLEPTPGQGFPLPVPLYVKWSYSVLKPHVGFIISAGQVKPVMRKTRFLKYRCITPCYGFFQQGGK